MAGKKNYKKLDALRDIRIGSVLIPMGTRLIVEEDGRVREHKHRIHIVGLNESLLRSAESQGWLKRVGKSPGEAKARLLKRGSVTLLWRATKRPGYYVVSGPSEKPPDVRPPGSTLIYSVPGRREVA